MILENLGHESWIATHDAKAILIDPLLDPVFGSSKYQFRKTAHAALNSSGKQRLTAVLLTTDHYQHCDIASLRSLAASNLTVYVSGSFAFRKLCELRQQGLSISVCNMGELITHGDFEFMFVYGDVDTLECDSRVNALLLSASSDGSAKRPWCFIQSDTQIDRNVGDQVPKHWMPRPELVVLTSHYKELGEPGFSPWESFLHPRHRLHGPKDILEAMYRIFPASIYPLNVAPCYLLAGGGYESNSARLPVATLDNESLAECAQSFMVNATVAVAKPGVSYACRDEISSASSRLENPAEASLSLLKPFDVREAQSDCSADANHCIQNGLGTLATALLLSGLGRDLLFTNHHLGKDLGSLRFGLQLLDARSPATYEFCFSRAEFVLSTTSMDELISLPAGIVITRAAFLSILKCEASAPEALTYNSVQWYPGSQGESPLALMFTAFSPVVYDGRCIVAAS
jgi:hypothetical protein